MPLLRSTVTAALVLAGARPAEADPLVLDRFFDGPLSAKGTVENLRDGTKRDFTIAMQGHWDGPRGTLVEDVVYADGERDHKVWSFTKTGEGRYTGRRADVTRDADIVEDPQGVTMTYKADTKVPAGLTLDLSFSDRFRLVAPNRVSVRSDVSYLFVPAATVTLDITKAGQGAAGPKAKTP